MSHGRVTTPQRRDISETDPDADDLLKTIRANRDRTSHSSQSIDEGGLADTSVTGGDEQAPSDAEERAEASYASSSKQMPASFKRRVPSTAAGSPVGKGAAPSSSRRAEQRTPRLPSIFRKDGPTGGVANNTGQNPFERPVRHPKGLRTRSRVFSVNTILDKFTRGRAGSQSTLNRKISEWQKHNVVDPDAVDDNEDLNEDEIDDGEEPRRPEDLEYPRMLPALKTPEYQTPLPKIPIIVLAICMLGEFLSASVGGPFLFFMLEDLGVPGGTSESAVGLWAGIVSASFFLSQFLTALLWSSLSVKIGRRAVLLISLLGNSVMLLAYGTCKSVPAMVLVRLLQGVFNGSVGVARGAVKDITDASNEGRAYSIIGLCWSLGGIVGPMIGGWLEHPVENLPQYFGNSELFRRNPYLLPTATAASVTFIGALLCLFLSYDGGPREGGIRLPEEKDMEQAVQAVAGLPGTVKKKVSGLFNNADTAVRYKSTSFAGQPVSPLAVDDADVDRSVRRQPSKTSFRVPAAGSAYGYSNARKLTGLSRYRALSMAASTKYAPDYEGDGPEMPQLNLAQRLLLANDEAAVFNISDIWLAAATREENLAYQPDQLDENPFADDEDEDQTIANAGEAGATVDPFMESGIQSVAVPASSRPRQDSVGPSVAATTRKASPLRVVTGGGRARAGSIMSTMSRPALYNNTGLNRSPVASPVAKRAELPSASLAAPGAEGGLDAIQEGRPTPARGHLMVPGQEIPPKAASILGVTEEKAKPFSMWRDLPVSLIAQWTILALHGTIMDQVFMSYLVTKSAAGGLGLEASDFADVIAIMCIFQMLFQFRFYPTVSLPAGSLTHIQMFRLGLVFYITTYTFFPELRTLQGPGGEPTFLFQFGLILLTAIRYLATTCAYTAIMILVNAMTHPDYVPLANGLAQSTVSLARFVGPLSGGLIWSRSIAGGPEGYYIGFMVVSCIALVGLAHSFTIR